MNEKLFERMKRAIDQAPRKGYVAELHLQVLKYADLLENVSGKDFCAGLNLSAAWSAEFAKMKKIYPRLVEAGLDPAKL